MKKNPLGFVLRNLVLSGCVDVLGKIQCEMKGVINDELKVMI